MMIARDASAPTFDLPAAGTRLARPGRLSLTDLIAGGPTLLTFFKTTCPVCVLSFPVWGELARRYGEVVSVAAVSQDPLGPSRDWLHDLGFDGPVLDDSHGYAVSRAYQLQTVPTLVLVSSEATVLDTSQGWDRDRANAWDLDLARRSGRPSPGPLSTPADGHPPFRPG